MSETIRSSIGGIIGDICGSKYEFNNYTGERKDVPLFAEGCDFTDDTVCTIATMETLLQMEDRCMHPYDLKGAMDLYEDNLRKWCRKYPKRGYGTRFNVWVDNENTGPYGSYGNGAMMRIGPLMFVCEKKGFGEWKDWTKMLAKAFTAVTHNSKEAFEAVDDLFTFAWFESSDPILSRSEYRSLEELKKEMRFDETCQGTAPRVYQLCFISRTYEDLIKNAIYVGGDCDTIACITGSIWCCGHEIPKWMYDRAMAMLPGEMCEVVREFDRRYAEVSEEEEAAE